MARDYTKYTVKGLGENLNKRQLVFQIVKNYVEKNKPSFDELTAVFKDEIQGSKGFIRKAAKVEDPKRFNTKIPLKIKFGVEVVVSNQWGSKNMDAFLSLAKKLKYKVSMEQSEIVEKDNSIEKVDTEKSKMTKPSSQDLSVNIELRKGNQELICTIKDFNVNRENSEIKNMYDALLDNFYSDDFITLTHYHLFEEFIREIYHEFLTNSHPSDDEYGYTIEDMKQDDFDWWDNDPILVVTRIGEIDLSPIVNFDEDDEILLNMCCEMLDINEDDKDDCEDYIVDYMSDSRFSVDEDLFKEVMQEL
ncbi:hypothetical protein N9D29_00255 [Flavobacteriaceae bacterium]|nr:hypothetical protein [Flavobacteriaceae bacterium]|tara:strand:- start:1598 stop:2512 length:915 start_codon:yes stop_codon:yes gene_type:complete